MIKVTVQKNLVGLEDLLVGVGTVSQNRGPTGTAPVTITKINGANFPYDDSTTMAEKFDALQVQLDSLPDVVDEDGHMLAGYVLTSATDLNLTSPVRRLWIKEIDSDTNELYFGDVLVLRYDPTDGNIYIPGGTDYIAADAVVTAAYEAADDALSALIDALDTATTDVQGLSPGTDVGDLVQLEDIGGGTPGLPAIDGSQLTGLDGGVPIGTIVVVPYDTPDTNWLECDGQAISRTTYADLFAKIGTDYGVGDGSTTFGLPDLRGEFIRVWDNGRGIDTGRALGSTQTDSLKAHTHGAGTLVTASSGIHTHDIYDYDSAAAGGGTGFINLPTTGPTGSGFGFAGETESSGAHTHTISGSTASSGSSETRPRNLALMAMIKVL